MKFLADECCDAPVVHALRDDGHDVLFIAEEAAGASDEQVLKQAFEEKRLLLTEDKDFGTLVYRLRQPACGILLMRFAAHEKSSKVARLRELIETQGHRLEEAFVVLEADKVRFRPLHFS